MVLNYTYIALATSEHWNSYFRLTPTNCIQSDANVNEYCETDGQHENAYYYHFPFALIMLSGRFGCVIHILIQVESH